jgi:hypothetical protein
MFKDKEWKGVDYLFFRNLMPNKNELKKRMVSRAGVVSFCCQCSWITSKNKTDIKSTDLRWICCGH